MSRERARNGFVKKPKERTVVRFEFVCEQTLFEAIYIRGRKRVACTLKRRQVCVAQHSQCYCISCLSAQLKPSDLSQLKCRSLKLFSFLPPVLSIRLLDINYLYISRSFFLPHFPPSLHLSLPPKFPSLTINLFLLPSFPSLTITLFLLPSSLSLSLYHFVSSSLIFFSLSLSLCIFQPLFSLLRLLGSH